MVHYLTEQLSWIIIFLLFMLYFSYLLVNRFRRKNPEDKSYKYIPAIAAFVVTVNLACFFTFGAEIALSNLISILFGILLMAISLTMFFFTLCIPLFWDIQSYYRSKQEGVESNEQET